MMLLYILKVNEASVGRLQPRCKIDAAGDFPIMHVVENNEQNSVRKSVTCGMVRLEASVLTVRTQAVIEPLLLMLLVGGDDCRAMSLGPSTCKNRGPKT